MLDYITQQVTPIVSLLLYLCSANNDIRDSKGTNRLPKRPKAQKTKDGLKLFPPDAPTTWEVGYRIGAAIRKAQQHHQEQEAQDPSTHSSPRPHIRRAHWHSFWSGSLKNPQERKLNVKWMPPIPVALKDLDDLIPTIHPVKA
jgi:hypothetical protein